jgi:hypothetical protein
MIVPLNRYDYSMKQQEGSRRMSIVDRDEPVMLQCNLKCVVQGTSVYVGIALYAFKDLAY